MTTHRERLLGQARADLTALPGLVEELSKLVADRHHDITGYRGKVIGSPAPLAIPVVVLVDTRHKPTWHGEDPRQPRWELRWTDLQGKQRARLYPNNPAAWEAFDRLKPKEQDRAEVSCWLTQDLYGIAATLEAWVRVLAEELSEWPDLTEIATVRSEADILKEHWPWIIDQQWAVELAEDVTRLAAAVRAQLGIRPEYRPTCRKCQSTVIPVDADRKLTSWEAAAYGACTGCDWTYPKGPALDALAQVQPPMSFAQISAMLGVAVITLRRYEDEGLISPTGKRGNTRLYELVAVKTAMATVRQRGPARGNGGKFTRQVAQDA